MSLLPVEDLAETFIEELYGSVVNIKVTPKSLGCVYQAFLRVKEQEPAEECQRIEFLCTEDMWDLMFFNCGPRLKYSELSDDELTSIYHHVLCDREFPILDTLEHWYETELETGAISFLFS